MSKDIKEEEPIEGSRRSTQVNVMGEEEIIPNQSMEYDYEKGELVPKTNNKT